MQVHKKQKTNLTCLKIDHQPSWNMEHMEVEVLGDEIGGTGSGRALEEFRFYSIDSQLCAFEQKNDMIKVEVVCSKRQACKHVQ